MIIIDNHVFYQINLKLFIQMNNNFVVSEIIVNIATEL